MKFTQHIIFDLITLYVNRYCVDNIRLQIRLRASINEKEVSLK